jgi:undecaprenyl diphosphate synthase
MEIIQSDSSINKQTMKTPKHIAFIMDGNGRWGQARGLSRSTGHKTGYEKIPEIVEECIDLGISIISVFVWSTENWARLKNEVHYFMTKLKWNLSLFANKLHERRSHAIEMRRAKGNAPSISPS